MLNKSTSIPDANIASAFPLEHMPELKDFKNNKEI